MHRCSHADLDAPSKGRLRNELNIEQRHGLTMSKYALCFALHSFVLFKIDTKGSMKFEGSLKQLSN